VELYEVRPFPGHVEKKIVSAGSRSALHTTAIVFDYKHLFIGNFNLDPRSSSINTEAGIGVEPDSRWYQRWLARRTRYSTRR
jgi:putative cardiolipin synthase